MGGQRGGAVISDADFLSMKLFVEFARSLQLASAVQRQRCLINWL